MQTARRGGELAFPGFNSCSSRLADKRFSTDRNLEERLWQSGWSLGFARAPGRGRPLFKIIISGLSDFLELAVDTGKVFWCSSEGPLSTSRLRFYETPASPPPPPHQPPPPQFPRTPLLFQKTPPPQIHKKIRGHRDPTHAPFPPPPGASLKGKGHEPFVCYNTCQQSGPCTRSSSSHPSGMPT